MGKSAFMTGAALANTMIGGSMIVLPVTFNESGILINVIFVIIMAGILGLTCKLLVMHLQPHQKDISESIKRKLGPACGITFTILCASQIFLVSCVYFLLASDLFYGALKQFFGELALSEQAVQLILMGVFALLNYLPDLSYVFKATPLAMACLISSIIVVIISIFLNIENIDGDFLAIKPLSVMEIFTVASVNGFAFIVHTAVSPVVKQNQDQRDNAKSVYFAYGIATIFYMSVGVLGALSIYGRNPVVVKDTYNIIDYYPGTIQAPIIGFLTVAYIFMISPIFPYICKNQISHLLPQQTKQNTSHLDMKLSVFFSLLWIPCNIIFIIFEISPIVLITFVSTVTAYYVAYLLPVLMTILAGNYMVQKVKQAAKPHKKPQIEISLLDNQTVEPSEITRKESEQETASTVSYSPTLDGRQSEISEDKAEPQTVKAIEPAKPIYPELYEDPAVNATLFQKISYGAVLVFGTGMLISEITSFFA